ARSGGRSSKGRDLLSGGSREQALDDGQARVLRSASSDDLLLCRVPHRCPGTGVDGQGIRHPSVLNGGSARGVLARREGGARRRHGEVIKRFREKPLIYNVVWKTAIYVVASMFVHYLEHLIPVWWRLGSFQAANEQIGSEIVWPHFWGLQIWLVVLIFLYCLARELIRVIGRDQVRKILFGAPRASASRA